MFEVSEFEKSLIPQDKFYKL